MIYISGVPYSSHHTSNLYVMRILVVSGMFFGVNGKKPGGFSLSSGLCNKIICAFLFGQEPTIGFYKRFVFLSTDH